MWRVAYGYMKVFDNVYCRHCFVIDENNKVIDPTLYTTERQDIDGKEYFVSYIFDDIGGYFEAIENNDYMPALEYYLKENDAQARKWAAENLYNFSFSSFGTFGLLNKSFARLKMLNASSVETTPK